MHLLDWPEIGAINKLVVNDMNVLRDQITQALSLRAKAGIKIRQPLASVTVPTISESVDAEAILMEELNVKSVEHGQEVGIDLNITTDLKEEGLSREIIRVVQNARKKAGLNVDDRIKLNLSYEQEIEDAINHFKVIIANETLSTDLSQNANKNYSYTEEVKVDGTPITISREKAGQK